MRAAYRDSAASEPTQKSGVAVLVEPRRRNETARALWTVRVMLATGWVARRSIGRYARMINRMAKIILQEIVLAT